MNKFMKIGLSVAAGSIIGYAYYYFVGCSSGGCMLTSNWYVTTLYGAAVGLTFGFPMKKKEEVKPSQVESSEEVNDKMN